MGLISKIKNVAKKAIPPYKQVDRAELQEVLVTTDPTPRYKGKTGFRGRETLVEDLPFFRIWYAQLMLNDPVVLQALNARDAVLSAAEVEVTSRDERLKNYIETQWSTIWDKFAPQILKTKRWGYSGFQLDYGFDSVEQNTVIEDLKDFAPHDVRPAVQSGKVVGVFVKGGMNTRAFDRSGVKPILNPRAFWTTFDAEFGVKYGRSIMRRSFGPWWEKWMDHGSKKVTQLRMIKDAYIGAMITYPMDRTLSLTDGTQVSWRDIAREMTENALSGATMTMPTLFDKDGNKLIEYTGPQDTGNPTAIWTWGENLDRDIRLGMDMSEEIIQAASSGSGYSGRSIPLIMFLQACQTEFMELLRAIDQQVLKPLAWLNFGDNPEYNIKPKSLAKIFAELTQGTQMGGTALGGDGEQDGQPRRPSQFEQVKGPRGGVSARNTETGATVGGKRGQELLSR